MSRNISIAVLCLSAPALLGASAFVPVTHAGTSARQAPQFDPVSIKPCPADPPPSPAPGARPGFRSGGPPSSARISPGYARWECATLTQLVDQAYSDQEHPLLNTVDRPSAMSLQPKRVRGGPSWAGTDKFTIEAKASPDVTGNASRTLAILPAPMSLALRAVLEDRFQVKVHRATEDREIYVLTVGKGGINKEKMTTPVPGDCMTTAEYSSAVGAGQVFDKDHPATICGMALSTLDRGAIFSSSTIAQLAKYVSGLSSIDAFVLDRTGLDDKFNFTLKTDRSDTGELGLIHAVETFGLKLERTKAPAEYLVIDSAQKPRPDFATRAATSREPNTPTPR